MTATDGTGAAPVASRGRRGGPPLVFAVLGFGGLLLGALLILVQALGVGGGGGPAATIGPTGEAATRTRDLVAATLTAKGLQVQEPRTAYRPGESPSLIGVPRQVLQVVLPDDPTHGYVVVYELGTAGEADRVGRDFAAYLASGIGKVQYPFESQFVLRRVGQTLVFFPWTPSGVVDERTPLVAAVLETIGQPITTGG
jgi:hypothetical protein